MPIPVTPDKIQEVYDSQLTQQGFNELVKIKKIIKINFSEIEHHILISPNYITQLVNLSIRKLHKFLSAGANIRLIDDITKSLERLLPGKALNHERLIKVLSLEEQEEPIFFIHLAKTLMTHIEEEKNRSDITPIYQAAIIVKNFKIDQGKSIDDEKKDELKKEDIKKILRHAKTIEHLFTKSDLVALKETIIKTEHIQGSYNDQDFQQLVEIFLNTYAIIPPESNSDFIPEIIPVNTNSGYSYVHLSHFIQLLEKEKERTSDLIKKRLISEWATLLKNYENSEAMKKDKPFENYIKEILPSTSPLFSLLTADLDLLYKILNNYRNELGDHKKFKEYFNKNDKSGLNPYLVILKLQRMDIYREAYNALPFLNRFFLTRLILYIIKLFKSKQAEKKPEEKNANENSESETDDDKNDNAETIRQKKEYKNKIKKYLDEIEKNYLASGNVEKALDDLNNRWNIKIGEVRVILREKVDKDTDEKSLAIFKMMYRSPNFSIDMLHKQLRNMANSLCHQKYSEVHDKKSLAMYIIIRAIWVLRFKAK